MNDLPDWERLYKALSVEAERGFEDLMGRQYRFSEFMTLTFGEPLKVGLRPHKVRWNRIGAQFQQYPGFSVPQRTSVVTEARCLLEDLQHTLETLPQQLLESVREDKFEPKIESKTQPLSDRVREGVPLSLDHFLREIPDIQRRKIAKALEERLGLLTVRDALFYYPRDHIDYSRQVNIANLEAGETVTLVGTVKRCNCFTSPKNKKLSIFELILRDRTGQVKLNRFFGGAHFTSRGWQERLKRQYPPGCIVAASGLVKQNKYGITLDNPEIEVLEGPGASIESIKIGRVLPVYPLTEGVTADVVRQAVVAALPAIAHIEDPLPATLRQKYGLIGLQDAIAHIHFPPASEALTHARRRLVFDEFFYLQLGFLQRRAQQKQTEKSAILVPSGQLSDRFQTLLPFELTNAQQRVIGDILQDLSSETPMNRLVQGDVGSGKTVVAVFAILAALQSGYQAALMAPTEVLAEQHYRKLVTWFNLLYLPVELLTGSTKIAKRREIYAQLETGELPLLVGTHALIQDKVKFRQLGLVVIDEQHRFGVEQRARLLDKGRSPHVLTLTATPIPRTLALTLHGDLDVSQIDELPPGRQPIQTTALTGRQRRQAYDLIRREIAQGRQAYIILPMIEESEKVDLRAAVEEHKRLQEQVFSEFNVGLLHGRMNSADKEKALNQFRENETQIIVSTTVIEVGVDVPNATVMLVENAERFGLSQLHQLRGRVGRGSHQSFCLLMSGTNNPDARQRLNVLEQSQDGFFISEMDLRLRGPGEVLGRRQSGLADFALASLVEDQEVLNLARDAAEKLIRDDIALGGMPSLKKELEVRYQKLMGGSILT